MRLPIGIICALLLGLAGYCRSEEPTLECRLYDVRFLITPHNDFPGPEVGVLHKSPVREGPVVAPVPAPILATPEMAPSAVVLADMIKALVQPDSWDEALLGTAIQQKGGVLVIVQTPQVHQQIEKLLKSVETDTKQQVLVKALVVETAELPQGAYFDTRALAKLLGPQGTAGAGANLRIRCFNMCRTYVYGGTTSASVNTYTVAGNQYEPSVETELDGYLLDVRPMLAADRKSAEIETRFIYAGEGRKEPREITVTPAAAPAAPATGTPAALGRYPLELPAQKTRRIQAQMHVPEGQWVLAGSCADRTAEGQMRYTLLLLSVEPLAELTMAAPPPRPPTAPTAEEKAAADKSAPALQVIDVRDMICEPWDYLPPFEAFDPVPWNQADWKFSVKASDLADLIAHRIFPDDFADPATSIEEQNGQLFVVQRPAVLARIQLALRALRAVFSGSPVLLRGMVLATNEVPEANTFDDAALKDLKGKSTVLSDSLIHCRNAQRTYLWAGKEISYIQTYGLKGDLYEPAIDVIPEGGLFDICPVLSLDRSLVQLDVRFKQTLNVKLNPCRLNAVAPAADVSDKPAPARTQLDIDLPAAELSMLQTQVVAAPGKWVLAGLLPNPAPKAAEKNLLILVRADLPDQPEGAMRLKSLGRIKAPARVKVPVPPQAPPPAKPAPPAKDNAVDF